MKPANVADETARLIRVIGRRAAREDPDHLACLRLLDQALAAAWTDAIAGPRRSPFSDSQIGEQLGVTKQAVQGRWPRPPKHEGAA